MLTDQDMLDFANEILAPNLPDVGKPNGKYGDPLVSAGSNTRRRSPGIHKKSAKVRRGAAARAYGRGKGRKTRSVPPRGRKVRDPRIASHQITHTFRALTTIRLECRQTGQVRLRDQKRPYLPPMAENPPRKVARVLEGLSTADKYPE